MCVHGCHMDIHWSVQYCCLGDGNSTVICSLKNIHVKQ